MKEMIVIGVSDGGLSSLKQVLSSIPSGYSLPIVIFLNHPELSGASLAFVLKSNCVLPVVAIEDKQSVDAGCVYVAPPRYQLLLDRGHFALASDEGEQNGLTGVDRFFEVAAAVYGRSLVAVRLGGEPETGKAGLAAIGRQGGIILVESQAVHEPLKKGIGASIELCLTPGEIGAYLRSLHFYRPSPAALPSRMW